MSKLDEFFNNSILDEMCDNRFDEFESAFIRSVRNKKEMFYGIDYEQELIDIIAENVQDEEKRLAIRHKLNDLEASIAGDLSESIKRAYKLGFVDAMKLKEEVKIWDEEVNKKNEKQ